MRTTGGGGFAATGRKGLIDLSGWIWQSCHMKFFLAVVVALMAWTPLMAKTISVVTVFEPISMHGTDGGEALSGSDEVFQATVIRRSMVLSGAFPESLIEAIKTPHKLPTNDPEYVVDEVNLLMLCRIGIEAEMRDEGLLVTFDLSKASIPDEVDATLRQVMRLAIFAVRQTLELYQAPQPDALAVVLRLRGLNEATESLKDLEMSFEISGQ